MDQSEQSLFRRLLVPRTLRQYWDLCDQRPPGREPQRWEALTELGEAWLAMPLPVRVALCARVSWLDAIWETWPRLGGALIGFRDGWRQEHGLFPDDNEIVATRRAELVPD
jgi:hypothetical protein